MTLLSANALADAKSLRLTHINPLLKPCSYTSIISSIATLIFCISCSRKVQGLLRRWPLSLASHEVSVTLKMSTSIPKHPLDPLTADEILKVSALLKAHSPKQSLHFKIITIIEPPKTQLRPFLKAERNGAIKENLTRKASSLYYHRGTADLFLAEVNLDSNSVESVKKLDPQFHGQNDIDESNGLRIACLRHPKVLEEIKKFKLPEHLEVVCDPWPYGRDSEKHLPRYVQVSSRYLICEVLLISEVLSVCTRPTPGFESL